MGCIDIYGMDYNNKKVMEVYKPYAEKYPIQEGEAQDEYVDRVKNILSDEDMLKVNRLEWSNIQLIMPILGKLIISPKWSTITVGQGARLMQRQEVMDVIDSVMEDINSLKAPESTSKNE
jgi:hypothetical protein